jgi:hypothetical protein
MRKKTHGKAKCLNKNCGAWFVKVQKNQKCCSNNGKCKAAYNNQRNFRITDERLEQFMDRILGKLKKKGLLIL